MGAITKEETESNNERTRSVGAIKHSEITKKKQNGSNRSMK